MSDWAHYYARAHAIAAQRAGADLRQGTGSHGKPMVDFHGRPVYDARIDTKRCDCGLCRR